jgi:voltage-gated sodium channel
MASVKASLIEIREARWFSNLTTTIIILYAIILGFKTSDEIEASLGDTWYYLDLTITLYFLVEIMIKMSAAASLKDFFKDKWNTFDFFIVVVTLIPVKESDFAMIARLMRLFRIMRLFNSRPELKKIIDMLIGAIPSIIDIVILMFIIFYMYAIVGSFLFDELKSGLWNNLLIAMLTLFRVLTFEDWTDVMYEAMEVHPWAWVYFVSFVIIAAFVFFNLFVAVIIGEMEKLKDQPLEEEIKKEEVKIDELHAEIKALREDINKLIAAK